MIFTICTFSRYNGTICHKLLTNPLTPTVAMWVQLAIKHPVPDVVKPSFVIFDILAL